MKMITTITLIKMDANSFSSNLTHYLEIRIRIPYSSTLPTPQLHNSYPFVLTSLSNVHICFNGFFQFGSEKNVPKEYHLVK